MSTHMPEVAIFQRMVNRPGAVGGPLAGLRFAVKDVIDVAGEPTTAGSRAWAASHPPAAASAPVVDRLLAAGASLVGKTISDELAFSLNGTNPHFGTPPNPAAPGHLPGGSSSGSASAVASGACDFALGTDTGGSVRLPASYCGIFGIRPTGGRVDLGGVTPLSPTFDTVGWLARDAVTMARVGSVLLGGPPARVRTDLRFVPVAEAMELADTEVAGAIAAALERRYPGRLTPVRRLGIDLREWARVRGTIQGHETWQVHGGWAQEHLDQLGPGVRARLLAGAQITRAAYDEACADRAAIVTWLDAEVARGEVLCLPTTPAPAPTLTATPGELAALRDRVFALMAPAGLWNSPQLTVPAGTVGTLPVGLSLLARPGEDEALLRDSARIQEAPD
jgi:amidase